MVIPESIIPCGIKLIFFDYDDTLFVITQPIALAMMTKLCEQF